MIVSLTPLWAPGSCLAAFPASGDAKDTRDLQGMLDKIKTEGRIKSERYTGKNNVLVLIFVCLTKSHCRFRKKRFSHHPYFLRFIR